MMRSKSPVNTENNDVAFVKAIFPSVDVPTPRASLKVDVLASFDQERRELQQENAWLLNIRRLAARYRLAPAALFSSVAAAGLTVGVMTTILSDPLLPEDEVYFYNDDTAGLAVLESEEYVQWLAE